MVVKLFKTLVPWGLLTLCFVGCSPKERTIAGQVFIVTQGSENIKLGLVEVALIQSREIENFLTVKKRIIAQKTAALTEAVSKAQSNLERAQKGHDAFIATNADYVSVKTKTEELEDQMKTLSYEPL
jgi:hypothetical protein